MSATAEAHVNVKDALDHARAAAQELHGALSDAVAEHGEAITSDLEALPLRPKPSRIRSGLRWTHRPPQQS